MKVVALIQVRMKSERLPGKALAIIEDKPLIEHIIERLKNAETLDSIVLCTSTNTDDRPLLELAKKAGVKSFAGSEDDVLERFIKAAEREEAEIIVRVTGDNPLIDPHSIDKMVRRFLETDVDYITIEGLPRGTRAEVISINTLKTAHELAENPEYTEYMTNYIRDPDHFKIQTIQAEEPVSRPKYRLTVDTPEDLKLIREIYKRLYKPGQIIELSRVVALLDAHHELAEINAHIKQTVFKLKQ